MYYLKKAVVKCNTNIKGSNMCVGGLYVSGTHCFSDQGYKFSVQANVKMPFLLDICYHV